MTTNDDFQKKYSKVWTRKINRYYDDRGHFLEHFRQNQAIDIDVNFVQDSVSFSHKNVLRGLHIQENQWQLSTLLRGSVRYFVLDVDPKSSDYLKLHILDLSTEGTSQVLAAPGVAHGFFAESSEVVMAYKTSTYYDDSLQYGINFSSFSDLNITFGNSIRSIRDMKFVGLTKILSNEKFNEFQSRII
ncbi:dTDP-4-dehydrorhamnose 3,5-epimerase family protein [Candidatus Planktophila lacus]|uniref:dTDP-4-dehydrorhamnose 3,5-epimerase n=1 Tax=Candidatus Planktophila lacus TaxID=1884913 RepID=A0AAC9YPL8_9ACTN|nr:dTDP-4-dehydrorhamnose 3,5-epimerase [Candidatus Planktophila lacus]